jgi:hypothetical protein
MNRTSDPISAAMTPFVAQRRALEMRIEQSKARLRSDLAEITSHFRTAMVGARHGLVTVGVRTVLAVGALVVLGVFATLVARRRRRVGITWR